MRVELFADDTAKLGRRKRVETRVQERCVRGDLWSDKLTDETVQCCSGCVILSDDMVR